MADEFDCIVVGAGVAGSSAAIRLAQGGASVLLVDRGNPIGSKNLSGGVLWGHELDRILPNWWKEGPVERPVTTKQVVFLNKEDSLTLSFKANEWSEEPHNAFMVLRARFDKWLAEQAEKAGAMVVPGTNVDKLAFDGKGQVTGVMQAGETVPAKSVVIADGCNSRVLINSGLKKREEPDEVVLGVKEVIQLPEEVIEQRFNLGKNQGLAGEYILGYLQNGVMAGGFLYTNRDTISLGVVINLKSIWMKNVYTREMVEDFRTHPHIAKLLEGGEVVEYGAHLIPEWGVHDMPPLYGNGWCTVGDAAGFVFSNGLIIEGMNYAAASGIEAADTILEAKKKGDYSAKTMRAYEQRCNDRFIMKDMKRFKNMGKVVWNERMFSKYSPMVTDVFKSMLTEHGEAKKPSRVHVRKMAKKHKIKPWELLVDGIQGARYL